MHTELSDQFANTEQGKTAKEVIAKCVHCGFCNATCPTYQLLGDELDGPRGRIYQIKQVLEGATPTTELASHLDRCLTCRSCETTCPSGVEYHKLLDIGREVVEQQISRKPLESVQKWVLKTFLSRRQFVTPMIRSAQLFRGFMPSFVRKNLPEKQNIGNWPGNNHSRKMLILDGCVQPGMKPLTNFAAARVLDKLGISLLREKNETCCGALSFHLNDQQMAKAQMRRNIDAWWSHVDNGVEAIISTASGCGVMVKDYAKALADDQLYAKKATVIAELTKDLSQVLVAEDIELLRLSDHRKVAFHSPCTLQHGQKLNGVVESILKRSGFDLTVIRDSHLCCGSAGTYSIFQKEISSKLLENKLEAINTGQPDVIASANIGCQLHLESAADVPVIHWIELLNQSITD